MRVRHATAADRDQVIVCARYYDDVQTSDEHVGNLFDLALANEGMFVAVDEEAECATCEGHGRVDWDDSCAVCESTGEVSMVVGFACAIVLPHPFGGFPYLDVVAVFVQPSHRKTWAGAGLVRSLLRWCSTLPLDMVKMAAPLSSQLGTLLDRAGFAPAELIYLRGAAWRSHRS